MTYSTDSGAEDRFERFADLEEGFDAHAHGATAARIRPSRQFVEVKPVAVEPTRLHPERKPLTDEEAEEILADLAWEEEQSRRERFCGLE